MSTDLILFRRTGDSLDVLPIAREMLNAALGLAALVPRVSNAQEQEKAVSVQLALKRYLNVVEESRKFMKQPAWDFCVLVDASARKLVLEAQTEMMRISGLIGTFQEHEKSKVRAAEAARLRELDEIERKRQAELAVAKTPEESDAIQERFNNQAAALPITEPIRADAQVITEDWQITITDAWLLARSHPSCVDIKPRISEIKALLKANVKVHGIIATAITKANVRVPKGKILDI